MTISNDTSIQYVRRITDVRVGANTSTYYLYKYILNDKESPFLATSYYTASRLSGCHKNLSNLCRHLQLTGDN